MVQVFSGGRVMTMLKTRIAGVAIAAFSLLTFGAPAFSSTFVAWRVTNVSAGDLLNVRAYPAPSSTILVGYPNGTTLSMTGRCTGGVNLDAIGGLSSTQQRQMVRYQWCETWLDPDGDGEFRNGWVYGRYIRPS
jgi:hypothetical protein